MITKKKSTTKPSMRERLLKRKEEIKARASGGSMHYLKEGTLRFRHLPMGKNEEPALEVVYWYLGNEIKGVIDPSTFGEKSAILKAYEKFKNSANEDDRAFAKKWAPKKRYIGFGIRYKDEQGKEVDEQNGAKPILLTSGLYTDLIDLYLDEDEAGDFTDPENGYDVKYQRTGTGMMDTEYSVRPCKPTPVPKAYRGKIFSIEEEVRKVIPSYEETKDLIKRFLSVDPEELFGDDGKAIAKKKTTKKRSRDIDDEELPRKRKRKPIVEEDE